MDIDLYNYVDCVLTKLRLSNLEQEMIDKSNGATTTAIQNLKTNNFFIHFKALSITDPQKTQSRKNLFIYLKWILYFFYPILFSF